MKGTLAPRGERTGVWWRDHSLSLTVAGLLTIMTLASLWFEHRVWVAEDLPVSYRDWWLAHASIEVVGSFAEILTIVLLTKWLVERGSAESN